MIEIENLSKSYHQNPILNKVSITLPDYGVMGLFGPKGSGKTLFFKILMNLIHQDEGMIKMNGKTEKVPQKQISYIPSVELYPIKVKELEAIFSLMHDDFDSHKFQEIITDFEIDGNDWIKNLSKGKKACLNIALTISRHVRYYLLDELFDSIDVTTRDRIIENMIKYIDFTDQFLLLSTHEIEDVERLIDSFILLDHGEFSPIYTTDEIRSHYNQTISEFILNCWEESHETGF